MKFFLHFPALCLLSFSGSIRAADTAGIEFFEGKIRPVLVEHCYECHSAESEKVKGGFMADTREGIRRGGATADAVVPGNVELSLLLSAIGYEDEDLQMPPKHRLPADVVANFVKWIEMGAPDPRDGESKPPTQVAAADHWAYQKPVQPNLPEVSDPDWPRDRIDRFVLAKLDETGLRPAGDADRRTLIRRATLELTGLPPTPAEIAAFVNDPAPERDAFATVLDRLLASDAFGVRWGRHWLDVARYAESSGYDRNMTYPLAWKYRNWVIEAFNADLPYDEFIRHQIAGDLIPAATPEERDRQVIATAFLTIGPKTLNEKDEIQFELNTADEQIDATCRAFLALTANCARCHDHKYDPIPARDYYALAGVFRSTRNLAGAATNVRGEHEGVYPLGEKGWERLEAHEAHEEKAAKTQEQYLAAVKGRNLYREYLEKRGLDWKKVDDPDLAAAEEIVQAWQDRVKAVKENVPPYPEELAMAVTEAEQMVDSPLFDKGNVEKPLDPVPRGTLEVFDYEMAAIGQEQSGRLQLAEWIVDRRNPLTARVFVNRVWHHLFGIGLVETVDNFGALGAEPVNQALLDDLALRFMDGGWSMKRLIRTVMLSRTYRLSSDHDEKACRVDPDARLNWRFSPQLLEGEVIRDSILAVSGQLDPAMVEGSQVEDISYTKDKALQREIGRRDFFVNDVTDDVRYRTVYLPWARAALMDAARAFDAADPNAVAGQRKLTTLPKQAMYLMNAPFVIESAELTAKAVLNSENPADLAYQLILGRLPTEDERDFLGEFTATGKNGQEEAWTQICQTLFCSGEFRTVY